MQWQLQKLQMKELKFATKHRRKLKKYYEHFIENSEKVLNYLKDDFKVKFITVTVDDIQETEKLSKHIEECKDVQEQMLKKVFPLRDLLITFRVVHKYYKEYLKVLQQKVNTDEYKDIKINQEIEMVEVAQEYVKYFIPIVPEDNVEEQ